jgi:hypothetical protein
MCLAAAQPASGFTVTSVQAHAEPSSYTGPCPKTVRFVGVIKTDGPGTVTYRWEHSPGTGTLQSVVIGLAGMTKVTKERDLSMSDFLELVVISPNTMSSLAAATLQCQAAVPKTDLTVPSLAIKSWGKCAAGSTLFTLKATIRNIGSAAYPLAGQQARIVVRDTDNPGWLEFAPLPAAIPASGGEVTVEIPVRYPSDAGLANHLATVATHQFTAEVDDLTDVDEALETNNVSPPVSAGVKVFCSGALKRRPPPAMIPKKTQIPPPGPDPHERPSLPADTIAR